MTSSDREDLLYSFEAIDHLNEESRRLYRLWLNTAISVATEDYRSEVTVADVKYAASKAFEEFSRTYFLEHTLRDDE